MQVLKEMTWIWKLLTDMFNNLKVRVPLDTILGPILFLVFLNDIFKSTIKGKNRVLC